MPENPLISIVDDDESVRETTTGLMRSLGFAAQAYSSAEEFLASDWIARTACLIVDVNMPGMTGLELCSRLVAMGQSIPTIVITAYPDERVRARALDAGVICYLCKPFDEADLRVCIGSALAQAKRNESSAGLPDAAIGRGLALSQSPRCIRPGRSPPRCRAGNQRSS